MTKTKHTLIAWLRDAHAMERASLDNLDRIADRLARFPGLAGGFRAHWQVTLGQVQRIDACLKKLGSDTSTFKDLATRFMGITQAYAVAVAPDEVVKDCLATYAWRYFETAAYVSLRTAALSIQEEDIARMCDEHAQQERSMADWLEKQIPEATLEFLRP